MAALGNPNLDISISIASDGLSFSFTDSTGVYSASNTGGYGTPNIASSSVTTAKIGVYTYGATVPYLFTFTIAASVVSALTLTAPDGTTTNIFADLSSTAFPFTGVSAFTILNTYLGYAEDAKIPDQVWTFTYEIIGAYTNLGTPYTFDLTTSCDFLVYCNTECCIKKMFVNLSCSCCDEDSLLNAFKAKGELLSAIYSAEVGQYDAAQASIVKASNLCNCGCSDC